LTLRLGVYLAVAALLAGACSREAPAPVPAPISVPDMTGLPYPAARAELRELGFEVRREERTDDEPANDVVDQVPDAGASVATGSVVVLTVSDGRGAGPLAGTPSAPPTWADVVRQVSSGIVRIESTGCESGSTGSGFLVAPDLVATVGHIVDGAAGIAVSAGTETSAARIVGLDRTRDLALLRADRPFSGHVFTFALSQPAVGSEVAALGYPQGLPLSFTQGTVSGLDRVEVVDGVEQARLIQTDAAMNPGNSGGPLLNAVGEVVGLAVLLRVDAQGVAYAISAEEAVARLDGWRAVPEPIPPASCSAPVGPDGGSSAVLDSSGHPLAGPVVATLQAYYTGINSGDYAASWRTLTPAFQERVGDYPTFAASLGTSYIFFPVLRQLSGEGTLRAVVTFTSVQEAGFGPQEQTCTRWRLAYALAPDGQGYRIDGAELLDDPPPAC
jgi:S1-C subfamily serine protease